MSFCSKCGANIIEGDSFCMQCGTPVEQGPDINPVPDDGIVINTSIVNPLKEKADAGDPTAMYSLGIYYDTLDNEKLVDGEHPHKFAMDWYEKAADAGHVGGLIKICQREFMIAILEDLKEELRSQECARIYLELFWMYSKGLRLIRAKAPGSELVNMEKFLESANDIRYRAACSLYFVSDFEKAKILVDGYEDTRSRILAAVLIHDAPDAGKDNFSESINRLQIILGNEEYGNKDKFQKEEFIYAIAARYLEDYYRRASGNNELGLKILNSIRPYLKDKIAIQLIDNYRSNYSVLESGQVVYTDND